MFSSVFEKFFSLSLVFSKVLIKMYLGQVFWVHLFWGVVYWASWIYKFISFHQIWKVFSHDFVKYFCLHWAFSPLSVTPIHECKIFWYYLISPWNSIHFLIFYFLLFRLDHFYWFIFKFTHFPLSPSFCYWDHKVNFSVRLLNFQL